MPATYAHDIFGKAVCQKLSEDIRRFLAEHQSAFMIGLQGPDILFYYHPFGKNEINELGHAMHRETAASFFADCRAYCRETEDAEALAYVTGFVCHYMLDSSCHAYIAKYMEKTGAAHDEIETELDRALMERMGRNPFWYKPAAHLKAGKPCVRAIAAVLGLPEKTVKKCIRSLRFYTGLTVCHTVVKRRFLLRILKLCGVWDAMQGHVMRRKPLKKCMESTETLFGLMKLAVPETVTVIEDFYGTMEEPAYLNVRFARNYE